MTKRRDRQDDLEDDAARLDWLEAQDGSSLIGDGVARAALNRPTADAPKYAHLDALSKASRGEISAERAAIIDHNEANDYDKRD